MKRIVIFGVFIFLLFIAYNLIGNIVSLWQKKHVVDQAKRELTRVTEENKRLKSQKENVDRPGFIEEEARNKLFYVKPDEQIVFVPQEVLGEKNQVRSNRKSMPAWRAWIDLFF